MFAQETLDVFNRQAELFEQAAALPGRARERIIAVAQAEELFFRVHPYHYRSLQLIRLASQLGVSDHKRRDLMRACESRLISLLMNIIRDAIRDGDLILTDVRRPEELAFTLWALAFGMRALCDTRVAVHQLGICDGFRVSRQTVDLLLDGLGWRPLSFEWDYERTRDRAVTGILGKQPALSTRGN